MLILPPENQPTLNPVSKQDNSGQKIRLYFLDALRAFAILMMLQGHFVDTLLSADYRDLSQPVFSAWYFMRGITAPVFFTVTGIVFVFLLLKEDAPLRQHIRVRKGLRRAIMLISLGYILKWNLGILYTWKFQSYHYSVDVLHIIGIALLLVIGLYALHRSTGVSYPLLSGVSGTLIFLAFPIVERADISWMPGLMANFLSMKAGSTFNIFPWVGYTLLGAVIGAIAHYHTKLFKHWMMPLAFIGTGLLLHFGSNSFFYHLQQMFSSSLTDLWLSKEYIFWRFGHVLVVIGIFIFLEQQLRHGFHKLFLKIGSETLTLYAAHYVILYGTWFGIGLSQLWRKQLNPTEVILGALMFEVFFITVIYYIEDIRYLLYEVIPEKLVYALRVLRLLMYKLLRYTVQQLPVLSRPLALLEESLSALFNQVSLSRYKRRRSVG
jgi:uncharacterized membrane protein